MRTHGHWGRLVRKLRTDRSWGTRELATAAGVHRSTLIRLETGESVPIHVVERVLHFFGFELDALKKRAE